MSDVLLFQTNDGGEIEVLAGTFTLDDTPATAAYLSLFGGNEKDDGSASTTAKQWWANLLTEDEDEHLRSETQNLLQSLPAVTANLRKLEDAAARDLDWMIGALDAEITVSATMPALNRVDLAIVLKIGDDTYAPVFSGQWGTS